MTEDTTVIPTETVKQDTGTVMGRVVAILDPRASDQYILVGGAKGRCLIPIPKERGPLRRYRKTTHCLLVLMRVWVPAPEKVLQLVITTMRSMYPKHVNRVKVTYEGGRVVADVADDQMSLSAFLACVVHACLAYGYNAEEVDQIIGKGGYDEVRKWVGFRLGVIQIVLHDTQDFQKMAECGLCYASNITSGPSTYVGFLASSFGQDLPRLYLIHSSLAPKTITLPRMFIDLGLSGRDEKELDAYIEQTKPEGPVFLLNEKVLSDEVKILLRKIWDSGRAIAPRIGVPLEAVVVTSSPTLGFTAKQIYERLVLNMAIVPKLQALTRSDQVLDAFLTHELLHQNSNIEGVVRSDIAMTFFELAAYSDGEVDTDLYRGAMDDALAELGVYRASDEKRLKTYLEYLLETTLRELLEVPFVPFRSLLHVASVHVAMNEKRVHVEGMDRVIDKVSAVPYYGSIVSAFTTAWRDNRRPVDMNKAFLDIITNMRKGLKH